jgi:hypothetical protein
MKALLGQASLSNVCKEPVQKQKQTKGSYNNLTVCVERHCKYPQPVDVFRVNEANSRSQAQATRSSLENVNTKRTAANQVLLEHPQFVVYLTSLSVSQNYTTVNDRVSE